MKVIEVTGCSNCCFKFYDEVTDFTCLRTGKPILENEATFNELLTPQDCPLKEEDIKITFKQI